MSEYISREAAEKAIDSVYNDLYPDYVPNSIAAFRECLLVDIGIIPSADVQPIRYGKWISHGCNCYECSNCHNRIYQKRIHETHDHDFCGRCGADMRGDKNG